MAVPILPNDTAADVFTKVVVAAELILHRTLPALVGNTVKRIPMDLKKGSYFSRRRPEDGAIDWSSLSSRQIHNLVRTASRPYSGAFTDTPGGRLVIWRT